MAATPRRSNDVWSLFLRQRRLRDQLRRLRNDYKACYCPPGCRGGLHEHLGVPGVDPESPPAQPLHGPHVPVGADLPTTWARPDVLRHHHSTIVAEARGTRDILLYRDQTRATLRMSMQVRTDASGAGRLGYFGEMFLTTAEGQPEQFIGFIQSWYMDRRNRYGWEDKYLGEWGRNYFFQTDMQWHREFMENLFQLEPEDRIRDRNGNLLPAQRYLNHFGAPWARINEDTDMVYIPLIWIHSRYQGQRIIDQGFELFWRLMVGGSLPEPYNVTRPLTAVLEAGRLEAPYGSDWHDPTTGKRMGYRDQLDTIARAYERNGFMRLYIPHPRVVIPNYFMGRRIDLADYPASPTDMAIVPPNPPDTDDKTPSPVRKRRGDHDENLETPESPSLRYRPKRKPTALAPGGQGGGGGGDGDHSDDDGDDSDDGHHPPAAGQGRGKPAPSRTKATGGLSTPTRILFP